MSARASEHDRAVCEDRPLDLPILYRWTPTREEKAVERDCVADEYVVTAVEQANCGMMLWARWGYKWEANPWSKRPVLRDMIARISQAIADCQAITNLAEGIEDELGEAVIALADHMAARLAGYTRNCASCRVCGCTDDDCHQCIERTGEPCHWVEEDLCSACVPYVCPQCGATLVTVNTDGTEEGLDRYCEECGYPDENRPADETVGVRP